METNELLRQRGEEYGEAWWIAGQVIKFIGIFAFAQVIEAGYMHNWVVIMSKMIRILTSPNKVDHWRDIAGYATLVARHITETQSGKPSRESEGKGLP